MTGNHRSASALAHSPNTFNFESHTVRVVTRDGEPWFVAVDLCKALDLDATSIRKLDDDEKGLHSMQPPGGTQCMAVVSEPGMYTLVLRCRDAVNPGTVPHRFRKWVTSVVLPVIRKTGQFTQQERIEVAPGAAHAAADPDTRYPGDVERALQLLTKHIYQADRYTAMLIVLQDGLGNQPVVISAGRYRHQRAHALADAARASAHIADLMEARA